MKATVLVRLKPEVLDPQGDAVRHALQHLGFSGIEDVRIGKLIEVELAPGTDPVASKKALEKMAEQMLANPVTEDFEVR